jgi:hypothetical protein
MRCYTLFPVADNLSVYPETKGVPLEEMDVVFGEGNVETAVRIHKTHCIDITQMNWMQASIISRRRLLLFPAMLQLMSVLDGSTGRAEAGMDVCSKDMHTSRCLVVIDTIELRVRYHLVHLINLTLLHLHQ